MAIPVSINTLLEGNTVEWARIEFKKNWNPETTLKTTNEIANVIGVSRTTIIWYLKYMDDIKYIF